MKKRTLFCVIGSVLMASAYVAIGMVKVGVWFGAGLVCALVAIGLSGFMWATDQHLRWLADFRKRFFA